MGYFIFFSREAYMRAQDDPVLKSPWSLTLTGGDILYLGITAIIYFALVFVVEAMKTRKIFKDKKMKYQIYFIF